MGVATEGRLGGVVSFEGGRGFSMHTTGATRGRGQTKGRGLHLSSTLQRGRGLCWGAWSHQRGRGHTQGAWPSMTVIGERGGVKWGVAFGGGGVALNRVCPQKGVAPSKKGAWSIWVPPSPPPFPNTSAHRFERPSRALPVSRVTSGLRAALPVLSSTSEETTGGSERLFPPSLGPAGKEAAAPRRDLCRQKRRGRRADRSVNRRK